MNKRKIGDAGENAVVDFLTHNKCRIVDRNFVSRHGEIDVIFQDGKYLVFGEVKERFGSAYGYASEAVTYRKTKAILYSSKVYLYIHNYPLNTPVRYDVFAVQEGNISWIKNAFSF